MASTAQAINDAAQPLIVDYQSVRQASENLVVNLSAEDCALQAADFVSPAKWHLAHTSWFFETFILIPQVSDYCVFNEHFQVLFNSYYNGVGEQFARPKRHLLSRPSFEEVMLYRHHIDQAMLALSNDELDQYGALIRLGLNHEQQHQELLLMDLKYSFFQNPLFPSILESTEFSYAPAIDPMAFLVFNGGIKTIGAQLNEPFVYDNETPSHQCLLQDFQLSNRLVSNGEYLKFIQEGGYNEPSFWLSDGWSALLKNNEQAPLYWRQHQGQWFEFTLQGLTPLDPNRPVSHLSFYEASAYAQWAGCRLPTEFEWEVAAVQKPSNINQLFNVCWQWTQSAYAPYPGYKAASGAVGEYNGKFMCNQMVLRGGCELTPKGHVRASYRNFFYPADRWPMTGLRLAKDV